MFAWMGLRLCSTDSVLSDFAVAHCRVNSSQVPFGRDRMSGSITGSLLDPPTPGGSCNSPLIIFL